MEPHHRECFLMPRLAFVPNFVTLSDQGKGCEKTNIQRQEHDLEAREPHRKLYVLPRPLIAIVIC